MKNTKSGTALQRVLVGMSMIIFAACGSNPNDPTESCTEALTAASSSACSVNPGTGGTTTTVTSVKTDTTTSVNTDTTSSVNTSTTSTTVTNTGTDTSKGPAPYCNYGYYPTDPAAGSPLNSSAISLGTWHSIQNNIEWVLNCTIDAKGNTSCCGTLLSEASNISAPSRTTWGGYSMEHCIVWGVGTKTNETPTGAQPIGATGYSLNQAVKRIDLTNSNVPTWQDGANPVKIAACQ